LSLGSDMRRREFISLLGGAAMWPFAAQAQQPAMPIVGLLSRESQELDAFRVAAFRQGMLEMGYIEGQNIALEYRGAKGHDDRLSDLASELIRRPVTVLVTLGGTAAALAAKAASKSVPTVFVIGGDPVKIGLVANLNRPGGNVTGVSFLTSVLVQKQLEVMHEAVSNSALIGVLINPSSPIATGQIKDLQAAAETLNQKILIVGATNEIEIEAAFSKLQQQRVDALVVIGDPLFSNRTNQLAALAAHYALPAIYGWRVTSADGGLMSYGTSITDALHLVGRYAGRILKGEKPGDLPIQQSTKVELIVNLKTAKTLGLIVPPSLLARADEVIE